MVRYGIGQSVHMQLVRLSQRASTPSVSVPRIAVRSATFRSISAILSIARCRRSARVSATSGVQELGDIVEGQGKPLRRFDHGQQGDGVGRVEPVPAVGPAQFGEQACTGTVGHREDAPQPVDVSEHIVGPRRRDAAGVAQKAAVEALGHESGPAAQRLPCPGRRYSR